MSEGIGAFYANVTRRNDGGTGSYPRYSLMYTERAATPVSAPVDEDPIFGFLSATSSSGTNAKFIAGILNGSLPSDEWTVDIANLSAGIVVKADRVTVKPGIVLDPIAQGSAPAVAGSLIYNTSTGELNYHDSSGWNILTTGSGMTAHDLTGAFHTEDATGGAGNFLKADSPTTFSWQAHGLVASDVGAYTTAQVDSAIDTDIVTHAAIATAHQDAPGLIATHAAIATAHQDAPALIATHAAIGDAHHTQNHALIDTTGHTVAGLTTGHFLKADSTTTYSFQGHGLSASDVGASPAFTKTQWTIPVFDTTTTLGDSMVSQDSGGTLATVTGDLYVTNEVGIGVTAGATPLTIYKDASATAISLDPGSGAWSAIDATKVLYLKAGTYIHLQSESGDMFFDCGSEFRFRDQDNVDNVVFAIASATGNTQMDGTLTVSTIAAEATDVDKFLVSNAGLVKFRTGAEVASDIGAATLSGVQWKLPVYDTTTTLGDSMIAQDSGGTLATVDGDLTINGGEATITGGNAYTPHLYVRTGTTAGHEAWIHAGGNRTTSTTSDISGVALEDVSLGVGNEHELVQIAVRKTTASTYQGTFIIRTNDGDDTFTDIITGWSGATTGLTLLPDTTITGDLTVSGNNISSSTELLVEAGTTFLTLRSKASNRMYFDCGHEFTFRDVDAAYATRVTIDSANGNIDTTGEVTVGTYTKIRGDYIQIYETVNDGNPYLQIGASTVNDFYVQAVYNTGVTSLDHVRFQSRSTVADDGKMVFYPDETLALTLLPSGNVEVAGDLKVGGGDVNASGGVAAFSFDASANVTKIGQDTPTTSDYLQWDGSKAVWTAVATGGGPGTGTQWDLPVWDTSNTLGDSMVSQDSGGTALSIGGSMTLGAGATISDIDTVMQASPTDAQLLTAQGIQEFIYIHCNIGSGNSDWINCPYEGVDREASDTTYWNASIYPGSVYSLGRFLFSVPLPTTRGGKSLYINGTRVSLSAATSTNRISSTRVYGMGNTTSTSLDDDLTSKQSVALHEDTSMGALNLGGYDAAKLVLKTVVATVGALAIQYVTVRYYYA